MKSPPPHRPLPPPVLVMATATLTLLAALAALAAQRTLAQAVNPGAGAVYFPKSRRALLFGGATRPTYFRTITALDLSKPFATNAAPFSTLPSAQLPTGTQYLIPWVSTSGSDVALFGGIVSNATSSTSVNVNGVIPASAIYEAKVTNDGAGVDSISSRQFVYNVQAPCYTLATIAGGVDDGKTYLFGGFSYFTNLETDELRVFDDSKSLKNVTIAGSTRPPRRQLGSLARIDARRLILSGGYLNNLPMADAWIFDLQASTWSPAGNLTSARYNHQTVVVKPSGSSKTYIVQVGGDSARSVFEYAELPASGSVGFNWKRSLSVEGKADLTYMVNQAPVVIGDQIVMFGVSLDPQSFDKFASVVAFKVKESSPGSLAFEWVENYVPAAGEESKPAIGPGSSGSGGDTGSGGTSSGGTSMTLVGILVGMAIIGVGVAGFLWFKRSKKKTAAQHKPLSNNANNNSTAPPPSGPPSVVSPQQPATVFAPAPNVHQQFPQQQPQPQVMQQQQQPAQLYQPQYQQQQQQQPMVDNRMSYMSTSMPQPQPQQPYDPRMSYMSTAQSAITTYPQSPPPTSHLSGPAPYPAAQMPIAYLPPHPPQPPTHAFPVSGIAPPMGPPAKTDDGGQDKAAWFAGQQQQEHTQQVYMMPQVQQVQTVPSAPQAPAQAMVVTPMPIPQQQQQAVQKVQGEEEEVLYLGGQAAPAPAPASGQTQPPGRPY